MAALTHRRAVAVFEVGGGDGALSILGSGWLQRMERGGHRACHGRGWRCGPVSRCRCRCRLALAGARLAQLRSLGRRGARRLVDGLGGWATYGSSGVGRARLGVAGAASVFLTLQARQLGGSGVGPSSRLGGVGRAWQGGWGAGSSGSALARLSCRGRRSSGRRSSGHGGVGHGGSMRQRACLHARRRRRVAVMRPAAGIRGAVTWLRHDDGGRRAVIQATRGAGAGTGGGRAGGRKRGSEEGKKKRWCV